MLRKLLLTLLVMVFGVSFAMAQTGSITGQVIDQETGETVPGANVLLVELDRGAATDAEGTYTINNVPVGTYTLRVSFVGYQTFSQQVQIQAGETLTQNVELASAAVGLDEVVVTGYGTETKREITGSISSVSSEDIEQVPVQNTAALLQGRASGVQVTQTSGTPGGGFEVNVRGIGSINAESQPLYIVDGVQLSFSNQSDLIDSSPLNGISPSNIESIEVLKDASAAAIYGAQAANGVVLITTKSGRSGDTQVSASVERGVRTNIESVDYFNRDQFIEWWKRAYQNTYGVDEAGAEQLFRDEFVAAKGFANPQTVPFNELPNTDWTDFVYREGQVEKYNASVSGGNETTTFRMAGTVEDVAGHIKDSDYQAYNLSANLSHDVSEKFSVRTKVNLNSSEAQGVCEDGFFINCPVSASTFLDPLDRPYTDDGEYASTRFGLGGNPAVFFNEVDRIVNTLQVIGNLRGTYNFTDWLSLQTQFGMDYRNTRDKRYDSPTAAPTAGGEVSESYQETSNFTTSTTLNFSQTFREYHNVSGLLGMEYRRDFTREIQADGQTFPNDLFNVLSATANPSGVSGFNDEFRTAGYFANVKYNYDSKYFLNLTARYDGSSRFGSENRWGFFPSASAAWAISEEDFFNVDFVEDLKFRVGYGETGNSLIGYYPSRRLYGISGSYVENPGLAPTQIGNSRLTWEESREINVGMDFALLDSRITGSLNLYKKNNKGLLLNTPLPIDSGFGSNTRNVGEVENRGIEFDIQSVNVRAGDFQWSTNFNIAVQTNEVVELSGGQDALNPSALQPVAVGHSINAWKVVPWAGVNPADGRPMWYDKNGNITYTPTIEDRKFFDGAEEDAVGGIGNTFQYKGLSLRVFFQYSYGQTAQPEQVWAFGMSQVGGSRTNGREVMLTESWNEPGDVVGIPKPYDSFFYPGTAGYFTSSTNAYWDASYIRLKNASLRYNLPTSLAGQLGMDNIQFYVTGLNLLTWTSYVGFDPEVAGSTQQASYPAARQINAGMEIQF